METITFRCSSCSQVLKVAADKAGRRVKCARCGVDLTIPAASENKPGAKSEKTAATSPPRPAPPSDEDEEYGGGTYGLLDKPTVEEEEPPRRGRKDRRPSRSEEEEEGDTVDAAFADEDEDEEDFEDEDEDEDEDRPRRKRRRGKPITVEPEKWHKVQLGLLLVFISICLLLTAKVLQWIVVLLGLFSGQEYTPQALKYLEHTNSPENNLPTEQKFDLPNFAVALVAGMDGEEAGKILLIVASVLLLCQGLVAAGGYGICMGVQNRYGTRNLAIAVLSVSVFNLIMAFIFKFLPLVGAMNYTLLPYVVPELPMLNANIDRLEPIHIYWSGLPTLEIFFAILLICLSHAELILFPVFLRACAYFFKDEKQEETALALVRLGLGVTFVEVAYQMLSAAGSSEVLLWVLRVVYILGIGFFLGQLIWYMLFVYRSREWIEKKMARE
jgi:hypothetical protein